MPWVRIPVSRYLNMFSHAYFAKIFWPEPDDICPLSEKKTNLSTIWKAQLKSTNYDIIKGKLHSS